MVKSLLLGDSPRRLSMKRTLTRIVLTALMADAVGTVLILFFAATFAGTTTENPALTYTRLAGSILAIGGVLALPTAALGVVLGDLIAPPVGVYRVVVFAALGAGLGAFMGTPVVGGISGVAGGIVGSFTREPTSLPVPEGASWTKLGLLACLVLVCALTYFSLEAITEMIFLD